MADKAIQDLQRIDKLEANDLLVVGDASNGYNAFAATGTVVGKLIREQAAEAINEIEAKVSEAQNSAEQANASATASKQSEQNAASSADQSATSAQASGESAERAAASADTAAENSTLSRSWAVGGTGVRPGEDADNAKYWAEQANAAAGGGVSSFNGRSGFVIPQPGDYTAEMVKAIPEIAGAVAGEFPVMTETGGLLSSGKKPADFAPAGFGLGESCLEITDWNTATKNGWYRTTTYDPNNNAPDATAWYGYTVFYSTELLIQVAYHVDTDTEWRGATRFRRNDVWSPWAYFQYPLKPGVEYRTTEMFDGKYVYAKAINMGNLAQGKVTVSHWITGFSRAVRFSGICSNSTCIPTELFFGQSGNYVRAYMNVSTATLEVNAPDVSNLTSITATLVMYYTKSTD